MLAVGHEVEFQTDQGCSALGVVQFYYQAIGLVIVTDCNGELWRGHDDQVTDLTMQGEDSILR